MTTLLRNNFVNTNDAKYRPFEVLVLAEAAATFLPSHVQPAPGMNALIQRKWLFAQTAYTQNLVETTQERLESIPPPHPRNLFHSLLFMICWVAFFLRVDVTKNIVIE